MVSSALTSDVHVQSLWNACLGAAALLQNLCIQGNGCFIGRQVTQLGGLPPEFLQLRYLQEVSLQHADLGELLDAPWLHKLSILDISQNVFKQIPPILRQYRGTLQSLNLRGALPIKLGILIRFLIRLLDVCQINRYSVTVHA